MYSLSCRLIFIGLLTALTGLVTTPAHTAPPGSSRTSADVRPMRVLIIGNSYVYHNDLPRMLNELAGARGRAIEVESVTGGGLTLKDHLQQGRAVEKIRAQSWDYVILQPQSQEALKDPATMRAAAKELQTEIDKSGARTLLFVTWARKSEPEAQPTITKNFDTLARELHAEMVPVGPALVAAQANDNGPRMYDGDGSHPSRLGSYLTACSLYGSIFDDSPVGTPMRLFGVTDQDILTAQATAWSAVKIVKDAKRAEANLSEEAKRRAALVPGGAGAQYLPSGRPRPLIIDNSKPAAEENPPAAAPEAPAAALNGPIPAPPTPLPLK